MSPPPAPEEMVHIGNTFSHSSHFSSQSSFSQHDNGRHVGQFARSGEGQRFQQQTQNEQTQRTPQLQDPQKAGSVSGNQPFGSNYTVQHGDTLWQIADRMRAAGDQRGNWDIIGEIARDNGIKNPDLIFPD